MLEVNDLSKSFGDLRAVNHLSFGCKSGEIFGLLGPNGAGKTTTISMIAGLLPPDAGKIHVDGLDITHNPAEVKRRLGVVPQESRSTKISPRERISTSGPGSTGFRARRWRHGGMSCSRRWGSRTGPRTACANSVEV